LQPSGHSHLRGSDFKWAIAFLAPYATVFLGFVVYPFGYALWMASKPSLYADLMADQSCFRWNGRAPTTTAALSLPVE
jgi:ABC-type sugar transport system permease subunit